LEFLFDPSIKMRLEFLFNPPAEIEDGASKRRRIPILLSSHQLDQQNVKMQLGGCDLHLAWVQVQMPKSSG
jgi:hypothetical protein